MTAYVYGIITPRGEHIDVSRSERSTKRYAFLHGYKFVSAREVNKYTVTVIAERHRLRWRPVTEQPFFM